jgi:hypothetical protein
MDNREGEGGVFFRNKGKVKIREFLGEGGREGGV